MSDTVAGAVEQVAAPKMISQIRDVPQSCICPWAWGAPLYRWVRLGKRPDCPWHGPWSAEVRQQP